mmetsp:Transcript_90594/g.207310  ORF Transcript_90594/g.207310 Transcript_90594/m.207310 type:complete len:627 (+) Transcript_90594:79-1959(+)
MKTDIMRCKEQLDEAVTTLDLHVEYLLNRERSNIRTELRAISITDLVRLSKFITEKCATYGWVDPRNNEVIDSAKEVNLYNLVYNFVGPVTAPVGHEVAEEALVIGLDGEVPGGVAQEEQHDGRRRFRYVRGVPPGAKKGASDPFVRTFSGSFAELLFNRERAAAYFVSHWWGEPVLDFVVCIQEHAKVHKLGEGLYWVCAYANSQTHIADELGEGGPLESPFFKALQRAEGAVLVVDATSTVTTRMWCGFENVVINRQGKDLAVATAAGGCGHVLTIAPAPADQGYGDTMARELHTQRQQGFPADRLGKAVQTRLEEAVASNPEDEKMIVDVVKDRLGGFDHANAGLRVLASVSLFGLEIADSATAKALNEAPEPYELFGTAKTLNTATMCGLRLHMCNALCLICEKLGDTEVEALGRGLEVGQVLTNVQLFFQGCNKLGDTGVQALSRSLEAVKGLTTLTLQFQTCPKLGNTGVEALSRGLAAANNLTKLDLTFRDCKKLGDPGVVALGHGLEAAKDLTRLVMSFSGCDKLGDAGVVALSRGLAASKLSCLQLDLRGCRRLGTTAAESLSQALEASVYLRSMQIFFCDRHFFADENRGIVMEAAGELRSIVVPKASGRDVCSLQ